MEAQLEAQMKVAGVVVGACCQAFFVLSCTHHTGFLLLLATWGDAGTPCTHLVFFVSTQTTSWEKKHKVAGVYLHVHNRYMQ